MDRKFKKGDYIVSTDVSNYYSGAFVFKINIVYKILKFDSKNRPIIDKNDNDGWPLDHMRHATSAEIRRHEGFSEELDKIINE